jgi:mono/diheme cytochrome c family protein
VPPSQSERFLLNYRRCLMLRPLTLALLTASTLSGRAGDAAALWTKTIQPLFDVQCVKCHGPIEQKSGLELDTPEAVFKGGDEGAVVVPGKPEESRLYQYLAADSDPHMPPKKQLAESEIAVVKEWIAALTVEQKEKKPEELPAFSNVTEAVDHFIAEGWRQREVTPAPAADDRIWVRRVWVVVGGRIPAAAELNEFLQSPAPDKRAALVDRLLDSNEHAVHLRELWDVFLMGRGRRENTAERRRKNGWHDFLEEAFRTNRPWNETVRDFLSGRPDKPERRGASWFLYERRNEYQQIAEAVAPVIYGTRIDCAQCHDHPLAREIKQAHYWGLVAAYNRSKNVDGGNQVSESAVGGHMNFTNLKKESQPALVTLLTGVTLSEARPSYVKMENDGPDQYESGDGKVKVPKNSRRAAFADAATSGNPLLARAFVNRMWAVLLGRGIVHPADEMNARNAPSHPQLLDWLAQDFARNYDARRLIRGLVLSRAYALSGAASAPADSFAAAAERPLTAEQLARSWRVAAGLAPDDESLLRAAVQALPDVQPREYNATSQQAQFLTNSPALAALLKPEAGGTGQRLAALTDPAECAREAFRAALGREPDSAELDGATALLAAAPDKTRAAGDLLWALLTSAEFLTMPR